MVLINGEPTAQIGLREDEWEVTGSSISDEDLLEEVVRRIRTNTQ